MWPTSNHIHVIKFTNDSRLDHQFTDRSTIFERLMLSSFNILCVSDWIHTAKKGTIRRRINQCLCLVLFTFIDSVPMSYINNVILKVWNIRKDEIDVVMWIYNVRQLHLFHTKIWCHSYINHTGVKSMHAFLCLSYMNQVYSLVF